MIWKTRFTNVSMRETISRIAKRRNVSQMWLIISSVVHFHPSGAAFCVRPGAGRLVWGVSTHPHVGANSIWAAYGGVWGRRLNWGIVAPLSLRIEYDRVTHSTTIIL
jgi:hypothetical protein